MKSTSTYPFVNHSFVNFTRFYRYGFNGMEKDDEAKGKGNSYTTEFRQYDPRLGRWLSIDPLFQNFPWQSPYVAFDNNPIVIVDPKGLAGENVNVNPEKRKSKLENKKSKLEDKRLKLPLSKMRQKQQIDIKIRQINLKIMNLRDLAYSQGGSGKNAVFGNGGSNQNGDFGLLGGTISYVPIAHSGPLNTIGFKGVRIDGNGNVDVFQVGIISDPANPIPTWPRGNPFGEPEGTPVVVDDDGNILDGSGSILIPLPAGIDINDGLYEAGESVGRGAVGVDSVFRKELRIEKNASGIITGTTEMPTRDITSQVEDEN